VPRRPRPDDAPRPLWQWAAGGCLLLLFGWSAFVRGVRVPLLGWIDLAIHEFGHLATAFLPEVANAMMGNGVQTLLPLALAGVFALRERDLLGAVVCLGWAATTAQDASVYIADAPHQRLQLIGGYHDWAFALAELDRLHQAEAIARLVWTGGLLLWIVAAAGCAAGAWLEPRLRGTAPATPVAPVAPAGPANPVAPAQSAGTARRAQPSAAEPRSHPPDGGGAAADWQRYFD
jgi:hypothetical protein